MNLNEYQKAALDTAIYPNKGFIGGLVYTVLGLTGESGEIANKVKKILRDADGSITFSSLADELGDVLWYSAALAGELGFDLEEIGERNIRKLSSRNERGVVKGSGDNR